MAAKVAPTRVTPGPDEGVAVTRPKSQMNLSVGSKRAPPSGCVEKLKEWMRQMDFMDVLLDPYIKVTALPWKASKRTKALQNVSGVARFKEDLFIGVPSGRDDDGAVKLFVEAWDHDTGSNDDDP